MNREFKEQLKKEWMYVALLLVALIVLLKIIFHSESLGVVLRTAISFFWMLVLPGFTWMYIWKDKLGFGERFIISIPLSAAVVGILSYHLGLIGLHTKYHGALIPILILAAGILVILKKK